MSSRNICKIITPALPYTLSVSCFVLETDPKVMRIRTQLITHRAFLVVQGSVTMIIGGDRTDVRPGSLVFAMKGETFAAEPTTDDAAYIYIGFDGARADEMFRRFAISKASRRHDGCDGLIPLWRESLARADEQSADLAAEGILLYTFSRISGRCTEQIKLVSRVIELSEERFNDPDLSIAALAAELGYNAKYLSHLFKEKMGITYSEYLRSLRIKYAVSLFDHGIDSVKNVALLSGFSDPLYFSSVFKKSIGCSPSDYRERSHGGDEA